MTKPTIPGYTILGKIADGGMSTVWKANQTSLDRPVALKVMNRGVVKTDEDVQLFMQEARASARLHVPGLCQIYDAGEYEGSVYYAMEYIAGTTVGHLLTTRKSLPEKQALDIADGVARILQAVWDKYQGVHCDIKPDNILIDEEQAVRITDFGVARFIDSMAQQGSEDYFAGTPNYTSPEQAAGAEDLDCRADIYGLGATLYHVLTGVCPFANAVDEQAMEEQQTGYLEDPQSLNPQLGDAVVALVEHLMVKDRAHRYPTWDAVLADVERVRNGQLPQGGILPAGLSTVKRTAGREQSMRRALIQRSPTGRKATKRKIVKPHRTRAAAAGAPRLKLPKKNIHMASHRARSSTSTPRAAVVKRERWAPAAAKTCGWLLLVGAAYWGVFAWDGSLPSVGAPDAAPEVVPPAATPTPSPAPRPVPVPDAAERQADTDPATLTDAAASPEHVQSRPDRPRDREPTPRATRETPPTRREPSPDRERAPQPTTDEPWDHPDYVEAMQVLRAADATLQQFLQSRDPKLLENVESDCRTAIDLLETVRDEAPPRARVNERIRQGYQIISNTRRMR